MGYYLRVIGSRLSYGFLLVFSLFLLFYSRNGFNLSAKIKSVIAYQIRPFLFVSRGISSVLENGMDEFVSLWLLRKENTKLRGENFDLRLKLLEFELVKNENSELKGILSLVSKRYSSGYVIKKINTVGSSGIAHNVQLFLSENDNILEHDLVLDKYGDLVGRVINTSKGTAEILLISDYMSKIPARLENSGIKVILGGNGSNILDINYFFNNEQNIVADENVYTSDDGNLLQEGILIGKVVRMGKKWGVRVNSDLGSLNFVVIISKILQ